MLKYLLFRLLDEKLLLKIRRELEKKGLKDTFVIEDDSTGETFIGGHSKKRIEIKDAQLVEEKNATVDWHEQWSLFASDFHEGKAHIDLGGKTLLLTPGPGFGDLSHPTTFLMLEMLKTRAKNESIVDIGTGSGILALAALALGAKSAIGIDIDTAALKHAKENAKLNNLPARFSKKLPKCKASIFLMNMIFPEQKELNPSQFNPSAKLWIVSGILASEKKAYMTQTKKWGWKLLKEYTKSDWLGFILSVE